MTVRRDRVAIFVLVLQCVSTAAFAVSETQTIPAILQPAEAAHCDIYKRLGPAVVGIVCKAKTAAGQPGQYYGTGAVISSDGLVLTDVTVIPADASEIKIYFNDGKVLPAELKSIDQKSEGVLIKITDAKNLPFMKLADTSRCIVGEPVYSWGNPHFSIQRDGMVSLSTGAISGIYDVSSVDDQSRYIGPVIETDAAVNPGSDGGPLTDADGNLVGIMSLGFSRTRWLGMTIPVGHIADALPDLKKLPTFPPPILSGLRADVWAQRLAFIDVSVNAAQATVGVWPVRPGDKATAPEKRGQDELQPLDPFPEGPQRVGFEAAHPTGCAGSGFLIDNDGTVLTSASHFDDKVKTIYVYLPDGSRVEAKLLGKDPFYDMAALKIDISPGTKIKPVEWTPLTGSATKGLSQGNAVAVLGRSESPGRLTLNSGSVSAVGRYEDTCTQISALIDYGNLGGPVIDLDGRAVGMAVHITERTPWRQNCGVGFMLNADTMLKILADLKAGKKPDRPVRPYLGVEPDPNAVGVKGARIKSIPPNSPAGGAGVVPGDTIIVFDGKPIESFPGLLKAIHDKKPGDTVSMTVKRAEKEIKVDVKLGVRE